METIEHFSDFLRKIGAHNFLAIGIVIVVIWLLISGLWTGLKKKDREREPDKDDKNENEDVSD